MPRSTASTERDLLERRALLATRGLVDRMRQLYRELEQLTGAPIAVHRALACVGEEPGVAPSRLAVVLGMQRPALSQMLKGLVARGWVERVRSNLDQRSTGIYLTPAGRQLRGATSGRAVGALQRAVRHLSNEGLQELASRLEKVLLHLPAPVEQSVDRLRSGSGRRWAPRGRAGARRSGTLAWRRATGKANR